MNAIELVKKAQMLVDATNAQVVQIDRLTMELEKVNGLIISNKEEEQQIINALYELRGSMADISGMGINMSQHEAVEKELRDAQKKLQQDHSLLIRQAIRFTEDIKAVKAGRDTVVIRVEETPSGAEIEITRPVYESNGFTNSPKVVK
jgi:hypothetical protein